MFCLLGIFKIQKYMVQSFIEVRYSLHVYSPEESYIKDVWQVCTGSHIWGVRDPNKIKFRLLN